MGRLSKHRSPRLSMKHEGVYLTKEEVDIIREKAPSLASVRQLSKQEKRVFRKIRQKIKNPDTMKRDDHGRGKYLEGAWLTPTQAKLLIAWKETALEGKITRGGVGYGVAIIPPKLIAKKWKDLFKETASINTIRSEINLFKINKGLNLHQVNVGIRKTRREVYLTKMDKELIKLRTVDKLTHVKISEKLGVPLYEVNNKITYLKKIGYEL